jgi:hypothetical protein
MQRGRGRDTASRWDSNSDSKTVVSECGYSLRGAEASMFEYYIGSCKCSCGIVYIQ